MPSPRRARRLRRPPTLDDLDAADLLTRCDGCGAVRPDVHREEVDGVVADLCEACLEAGVVP